MSLLADRPVGQPSYKFEATLEAGREALFRRRREGYGDPAKAEAERQALLQIIERME